MSSFESGYIDAIFFTECEPGTDAESHDPATDSSLHGELCVSDLAPEAVTRISDDCAKFEEIAGELLEEAYARGYSEEQAGIDFWFTRNGHGVGYWGRQELSEDGLGDKLSALCGWGSKHGLGEIDAVLGDSGLIYLEGG